MSIWYNHAILESLVLSMGREFGIILFHLENTQKRGKLLTKSEPLCQACQNLVPEKKRKAGNHMGKTIAKSYSKREADECVVRLPITDLYPPEFHPFLVLDDLSMTRLVTSIKQYGVREPGLARPRQEGGYELVAGNRRRRACELAGLDTMPVVVRDMDDDSSAIAMVDSNLEQREKLLFSERAWAYRVKLEAMNHRGAKSDTQGQLSVDVLAEQTGESKNQIFRLIRLTELIATLIDKVDAKQLAFNPAVELSYLSIMEQTAVAAAMERYEVKPSLSQAVRLKKLRQSGALTTAAIDAVLSVEKKLPKTENGVNRFRPFFPDYFTPRQIDKVITSLLRGWQAEHTH